jgi:prevent-host-death family protein
MQTVTLDEAQKHLAELVRGLPEKGELVITDANKPLAKLTSLQSKTSLREGRLLRSS